MVSAVENLSRVVGTITARAGHPALDGWDLVTLSVDRIHSVPGKTDLLSARTDEPLRIAVRRALLGEATVGWWLSGLVRVTPGGPMAQPYPTVGDWQLDKPGSSDP